MPKECEACHSTDIAQVPRKLSDKEDGFQRRYHCRSCKQDMLLSQSEAPIDRSSAQRSAAQSSATPIKPHVSEQETTQHALKIKALEDQLKRIDQDIDNSQRIADAQEADLIRAKLGVADLRNLDAVEVNHARLITLLNELHRTHCSKELVLTETEHERDQLRKRLKASHARFSDMETSFRDDAQKTKEALDAALAGNQALKQRIVSLEGDLASSTQSRADAIKRCKAALKEKQVLAAESTLEIDELRSQLNVARTQLEQTEVNAEREQRRLAMKVRDLESQLSGTPATQDLQANITADKTSVVASKAYDTGSQPLATVASNEPNRESAAIEQEPDLPPLAVDKYKEGVRYITGDGVARNETTAMQCFEQAADLGHPAAQHNLGTLKYKGPIALRDVSESIYWLSLAAAQGHQKATELLAEVEAANKVNEVKNVAV